MSKKSNQKHPTKHHGTALTIALVIIALHGIFATAVFLSVRVNDEIISRPWLVTLMVIHSFANVIAAGGIWYWKKWAWQLYIVSTGIALVVGLLTVGMWSAFYVVLPLSIVGWILRTKWDNFT